MADAAVTRLAEILEGLIARGPAQPAGRADIKAPSYDGSTDVELFLSQFHDVAEQSRWPEDVRLLQLRGSLKDLAYETGRGETVHEIYRALRARFGLSPKEARKQLGALRRDARTTLQEHAATVFRLANVAYGGLPEDARQELKLESFLASINHVGLQRHLMAIDGDTIEAAVRAGNEYLQAATTTGPGRSSLQQNLRRCETEDDTMESTTTEVKAISTVETIMDTLQKLQRRLEAIENKMKNKDTGIGREPTTPGNGVCWGCLQPGHLRRNCPGPKEKMVKGKGTH